MVNDTDSSGMGLAFLLLLLPLLLILILAFYIIGSIFYMKVFEKAGVQGKWRAWVPIYNTLIFVKLGDMNPWWLLVLWGGSIVLGAVPVLGQIIGLAAFVYTILAAWRVGLKLQKDTIWLVLYFFLPIVWLGILAFDKSRWNTAIPAAPWQETILADKTAWDGIPAQTTAGGYGAHQSGYTPSSHPVAPPAGYQPPPAASYPPPAASYPPPSATEPPTAAQGPDAPQQ